MPKRRIENPENLPKGVYRHGRKYRRRVYVIGEDGRRRAAWEPAGKSIADVAAQCDGGALPAPDEEWMASLRNELSRMYHQMLKGAKSREIEVSISRADLHSIAKKSGGRCAVSGVPFSYVLPAGAPFRRNPFCPSIDRIDSRRGYSMDNVRLVCAITNMALGDWGDSYLLEIAKGMVRQSQEVAA